MNQRNERRVTVQHSDVGCVSEGRMVKVGLIDWGLDIVLGIRITTYLCRYIHAITLTKIHDRV